MYETWFNVLVNGYNSKVANSHLQPGKSPGKASFLSLKVWEMPHLHLTNSSLIKELSSEQQEHAGDDAATYSTPDLVQASLRHGRSRAVSDCLNTPHHRSTHKRQYLKLFWLDNGGFGSYEKIGGRSSSKVCNEHVV